MSQGSQIATAPGLHALQARIQALQSDIHGMLGGSGLEALGECKAAAAVLDAEGDLEGLAEAWVVIGVHRSSLGDSPAGAEAFERAISSAAGSAQGRSRRIRAPASAAVLTAKHHRLAAMLTMVTAVSSQFAAL